MLKIKTRLVTAFILLICSINPVYSGGDTPVPQIFSDELLTLTLRDTELPEIMDMLSKKGRVNILLAKDVEGDVSINLYDVTIDEAIRTIAMAAGFAVEYRDGNYFVIKPEQIGQFADVSTLDVRTYKVQYSDPETVAAILGGYVSSYGSVTALPNRNLVVIEDIPSVLKRTTHILRELDRKPYQILIEAKILEITLDDSEVFGIDWKSIFDFRNGAGDTGIRGLNNPAGAGFFFNFVSDRVDVALDFLKTRGRVRTLSTPRLLVLENNEAEVVVGDRIGFKVTTTINQVTNESIEFLESGVILRVTPTVDNDGRIMLEVHPEVSTGTISDGIPSQTTTEVTTQLLVDDGQTTFIGGLLKQRLTESRDGLPILGDIPGLSILFSNKEEVSVNTETIVLLTPKIVHRYDESWNTAQVEIVEGQENRLIGHQEFVDDKMSYLKTKDLHKEEDIFLAPDP